MLKIRLMRIGATNRPFYRIVAVDDRKKRTGAYLDLIGTYNPLSKPKEIKIDQEKVDAWVKKGAQLSDGYLRIIGKAQQKPARKPKKDRGNGASAAEVAPAEKAEDVVEAAEEAPAEETAPAEKTEETPVVEAETTESSEPESNDEASDTEKASE